MYDLGNFKILSLLVFFISLSGCSHGKRISNNAYEIRSLESDLSNLEKKLKKLESGMLKNQQSLHANLENLHRESEAEFGRLNDTTERIKRKTDQFDIKHNNGAILFIPKGVGGLVTLTKQGFWDSSGGTSSTHSGNPKYTFDVVQESNVTITLRTDKDTDAYLMLLNRSGSILKKDDDGAGNHNSKIEITLEEGRYSLVAATYKAGKNSTFTLELKGIVDGFYSY